MAAPPGGIRRFATLVKATGFLTGVPKSITTSSKTLTRTAHSGRTVTVNRAAGSTLTLPAAKGTGDRYRIVVGTALTSGTLVVQVANSSDAMCGGVLINDIGDTAAATADFFPAVNGTSDTITLTQAVGGGKAGDFIEVQDIATNVWQVQGIVQGVTDPTTPFSAAV